MNKVRNFCTMLSHFENGDLNSDCGKDDMVSTILWPLTRVRHFSPTVDVRDSDIPWEDKVGKLLWRGGVKRNAPGHSGGMKWALVSKYVNSTLVDAKFADDNEARRNTAPKEYLGPVISQKEQLKNKYLLSIEGNDVSTGLKWMLFSNSLIFMPPITYESWAMEGLLKPFVHYVPVKSDLSNLEEQISWAESNPEDASRVAQRSTLFIYDLLFHPDALRDEQLVLKGMVERYENNFGYSNSYPVKYPMSHINVGMHEKEREDRFPSVESRVKYYMGKWFQEGNKVPMNRDKDHPIFKQLEEKPRMNTTFIASGEALEKCASNRDNFSVGLDQFCKETLPFFDERLVHDIKGNTIPHKDPSFKLVQNLNEDEWYRRILIDDSIKVINFGDYISGNPGFPIFAKSRATSDIILWPFDAQNEYDLIFSGLIEQLDTSFKAKKPRAVWRGGLEFKRSAADFDNRQKFVKKSLDSGSVIDAKFALSDEEVQWYQRYSGKSVSTMFEREPLKDADKSMYIRNILSHRYLIANMKSSNFYSDFKWMLLSNSVVLMPKIQDMTSWFMEEFLEAYVHFVPIEADYSDVEQQITWCENNLSEVERISERATLFVHDLLLHRDSSRDNTEVQLQIMERYVDLFGN
mmetsp:Transcript_7492/g.10325  ORF Transcript_7492/g.10325 Transcript_7492/m.10325 type:complete len:634 (-) Transcript_7492:200-2101(-)